ncbi:hypothetical protein BDY21DRAFT_349119 [Lineolata rhizophorae]|uniref:Uncharacterized protein n=1 Tax=Lineolata rhizophorae TaxID=578093 RepID=A0A6A6NW22_9PEZI|nr:hypothetical protein BDY21DRAFT_349119 [Lineolata rhizophorae]
MAPSTWTNGRVFVLARPFVLLRPADLRVLEYAHGCSSLRVRNFTRFPSNDIVFGCAMPGTGIGSWVGGRSRAHLYLCISSAW